MTDNYTARITVICATTGTSPGVAAHNNNFRAEHYWVSPDKILQLQPK